MQKLRLIGFMFLVVLVLITAPSSALAQQGQPTLPLGDEVVQQQSAPVVNPPAVENQSGLRETGFQNICSRDVGLPTCIQQIYLFSLGFGALVAIFMIILAGYKYMTAQGNAQQVEGAKESFASAFIGMIILFVAFILLNAINPDLTRFRSIEDITQSLPIPEVPLVTIPPIPDIPDFPPPPDDPGDTDICSERPGRTVRPRQYSSNVVTAMNKVLADNPALANDTSGSIAVGSQITGLAVQELRSGGFIAGTASNCNGIQHTEDQITVCRRGDVNGGEHYDVLRAVGVPGSPFKDRVLDLYIEHIPNEEVRGNWSGCL